MTATVAYLLSKKIALGAVSGISGISLKDNQLVFQMKDGTSASMAIPIPKDGLAISKVEITENRHLVCTMSDGSIIDAGALPSSEGTTDHNKLTNRNATNQHPISAITGLQNVLDTIPRAMTAQELKEILI